MIKSYIKSIEYYLPEGKDLNDETDRLTTKIGIFSKNIAAEDEFASDLACNAAKKMFDSGVCQPSDIDFLLYCTQSPDYILPTTACLIQSRLGLPTSCGAFDYNLGCSGYVYGLSVAKALIEAGIARNILLLTSDTYSKYIHPKDRSVRLLFGDAAAATLVSSIDNEDDYIGSFVFGTDGTGAENLIIPAGGLREPITVESREESTDAYGNVRSRSNLYMNGQEIFNFAMKEIPGAIESLLQKSNESLEDFDYFVFHQANQYMLETLRRKLNIDREKFSVQLKDCGNTVSSTIPIAIKRDIMENKIAAGDKLMLIGFGVGYSWAACSIKLKTTF